MNAEIVSTAVTNKQEAVSYLTWTFFYRRLLQNPSYYDVEDTSGEGVSRHLSKLVQDTLAKLQVPSFPPTLQSLTCPARSSRATQAGHGGKKTVGSVTSEASEIDLRHAGRGLAGVECEGCRWSLEKQRSQVPGARGESYTCASSGLWRVAGAVFCRCGVGGSKMRRESRGVGDSVCQRFALGTAMCVGVKDRLELASLRLLPFGSHQCENHSNWPWRCSCCGKETVLQVVNPGPLGSCMSNLT